MRGKIVIFSGPSGVGKDTVLEKWVAQNPRVQKVVTRTTRQPRKSDIPGVTYHFLSRSEFRDMIEKGMFLEWKEVHGNFYGTPIDAIERIVAAGGLAILKIDVQGAKEVILKHPEAESVFLLPPSWAELEHRIRSRAEDPEEEIQLRMRNAELELAEAGNYKHQIVNLDVEASVAELQRIFAEEEDGI